MISFFSGLQAIFQMKINKFYNLKKIAINNFLVGLLYFTLHPYLISFYNDIGYLIGVLFILFISVLHYSYVLKICKYLLNKLKIYFVHYLILSAFPL